MELSEKILEQVESINSPPERPAVRYSCDDLGKCRSVAEFKQTAKNILLDDSGGIPAIIVKARAFGNESERKKLVDFFDQLWRAIGRVPPWRKGQFLNRGFRRSNPTLAIPPEWLR